MKIIFFSFTPASHMGGFEKYIVNLASELSRRNHELVIIGPGKKFTSIYAILLTFFYMRKITAIERESFDTLRTKYPNIKWINTDNLFKIRQYFISCNVIYSKNELIELIFLKILSSISTMPKIIIGMHTATVRTYQTKQNPIIRLTRSLLYGNYFYVTLLKTASIIHTVNSDDEKRYNDLGLPTKKIYSPFFISSKPSIYHESEQLHIAFVARLAPEKGIDILEEIIRTLNNESSNKYIFKIAGSGDEELTSRIKALETEFSNSVYYLGQVPNEKINEIYDWCDVTVIPSLYETVNYVCLETGSRGKIAIASDITGPRDIIINGKTGYLLPLSADKFCEILKMLQKLKSTGNNKFFTEMGSNAKEYIGQKFGPEKIYAKMDQMIKS